MSRALPWRIRRSLLRERGAVGPTRTGHAGRSSRSGIAMLMAVSVIALMTVIVTEVVHSAAVRIQLAANQRDEAKAEALAEGGVQFYRLLLIASKQIEGSALLETANSYLMGIGASPVNADALWQIVPSVNTEFLRMLLVSSGDDDQVEEMAQRGLTAEEMAESREGAQTSLKKAFLDFDGNFTASVADEDGRIYVGDLSAPTFNDLQLKPHAMLLYGLMQSENNQDYLREADLEAWELIGDLADWADVDDTRLWLGGRESAIYESIDEDFKPKNAPFDTLDEIRMVNGWERDGVWSRFGENLTIYGNGRINLNSAPRKVIAALLRSHINPTPNDDQIQIMMDLINTYRQTPIALGGGLFRDGNQFVEFIRPYAPGVVDDAMANQAGVRSSVFRVSSEGRVGKARVMVEAVFDFNLSGAGQVVYWQVE